MTPVRTLIIGGALLLCSWSGAGAADLPMFGEPLQRPAYVPPRTAGLITNPFPGQYFVEPRRFDAYGYPVSGPIVPAAPNPLYAATGCPQVLQPVYDGAGNFAGYAPIQACR